VLQIVLGVMISGKKGETYAFGSSGCP
jgi:hypothetical protein